MYYSCEDVHVYIYVFMDQKRRHNKSTILQHHLRLLVPLCPLLSRWPALAPALVLVLIFRHFREISALVELNFLHQKILRVNALWLSHPTMYAFSFIYPVSVSALLITRITIYSVSLSMSIWVAISLQVVDTILAGIVLDHSDVLFLGSHIFALLQSGHIQEVTAELRKVCMCRSISFADEAKLEW